MSGRPKSIKPQKTSKEQLAKKADKDKKIGCSGCNNLKKKKDFYVSYNKLHINGRLPYCTECIKKMICDDKGNVFLEKVKEVLQLVDLPFIYSLWQSSMEEKGDSFGNYKKNLALNDKFLTWKDSVFLPEVDIKPNYENVINIETSKEDNKLIYSKKWMCSYTQAELDFLEDYLESLYRDFKIITENHKDYAKKIAKASLYMDKCFEDMMMGVGGADKKYKDAKEVFDSLSKSAQFAESGRGQNDVSLGCFGKVFERVEQLTWIYEHIPESEDGIDKIINQFKNIEKSV